MKYSLKTVFVISVALVASLAVGLQLEKWQKFTTKEGSLSLKLPEGWGIADTNSPEFAAALKKIRENNPKLAAVMDPNKPTNYALQCYDFSDDPTDNVLDAMNVIVGKSNGLTVKQYGDVGKELLSSMPFKGKGQHKVIDLPLGKALSYWGTIAMAMDASTTVDMDIQGYLWIKGENLYVVTFVVGGGQMVKKREWIEKAAKTIQAN